MKTLDQKIWWEEFASSYRPMHPEWGENAIQRLWLDLSGEVVRRISRIRAFSHGLGRQEL